MPAGALQFRAENDAAEAIALLLELLLEDAESLEEQDTGHNAAVGLSSLLNNSHRSSDRLSPHPTAPKFTLQQPQLRKT